MITFFIYISDAACLTERQSVKLRTYPEPIFNMWGSRSLLDPDFMTQ